MSYKDNILRIKVVHDALEELKDEVVFVGGATVALYVQRAAEEVRPTNDIDILVELADYKSYSAVDEKLRGKKFVNDMESGVICRYKVKGIIVDVMPTGETVLGFSNRWYPAGFSTAVKYYIGDGYVINIFRPEYFVATKLEAFKNRGSGDGRTSSDFEDLVYLFNHRLTLWQEMLVSEHGLRQYLKYEINQLLENAYLEEWIGSHLEYAEKRRVNYILGSLTEFVNS